MSELCPWDTRPKTLDAMAHAIQEWTKWEQENEKLAPISWCLVPTKEIFYDLITRLIRLEKNSLEMCDPNDPCEMCKE
jgi:hypothetical protein